MSALAEIELDTTSLQTALDRIAQVTTQLLPAEQGASVILWDEESETFSTASSTIPGQHPSMAANRLRVSGGTTRWIIDNRRRVVVEDIADDPFGASPFAAEFDVRAYVGVPVVAEGSTLGVLYALAPEPREWTDLDLAFLETLARRAAGAIANAHLIEEARNARERAEALSHVANALIGLSSLSDVLQTIVDGVAAALDADRVLLLTVDATDEAIVDYVTGGVGSGALPTGDYETLMGGLTGYAMQANTVIVSPKGGRDDREGHRQHQARLASDSGAVLVAPLRFQGRAFGTLTAIRRMDQPNFAPEDVGLITVMANQAAIAIENARLTEETEEALAELSAVFEIVKAQNTEQGLEELLTGLTEAAAGALPAHRVTLTLADPETEHVERLTSTDRDEARIGFDELWEGLSGWVYRNRRPALSPSSDDQRQSERVKGRRVAAGIGPQMVVPLFDRGAIVGTLTASNPVGGREFTQKDIEMASIMATQMSVAIANAKLFAETQRLAITDELTGVHNRRHLFTLAEREVATARRYGRPISAIMFDIDKFKQINDTYGHAVGDEVLHSVAERCGDVIRDVDVLGRYGGEEFAVLLPETKLDGAIETAERLRNAVGGAAIATSIGDVAVTISAGVAELSAEIQDVHGLLDRADAAMLFAKRLGRNRVQAG
jgi:diguanylate cyclase (GGDEF)-like protein